MFKVKQAIIIRKDLKMRRGKEIAQGSHASLAFISKRIEKVRNGFWPKSYDNPPLISEILQLSLAEQEWFYGSFAKICLQAEDEKQLVDLHNHAKALKLESQLITDSGATEFNGVPTITALAIGPDYSEKIDLVTKNLKLY